MTTGGAGPGRSVVPRPQPVPAPPPGVTDVLRRSARLGLGALGLAGRAAGTMFARVPEPAHHEPSPPDVLSLVSGAVLGIAIETERRASVVLDVVTTRTKTVARVLTKPSAAQRVLRLLEDALWHWNEIARREQVRNQAQAAALIPVVVQQVTENVLAQLDLVRLVEQIPIDDIAASVDVDAIVARIDLGGVIRESTTSLTNEAVDALRSEGIAIDEWLVRVVDRLLFRRHPRDLTVGESA